MVEFSDYQKMILKLAWQFSSQYDVDVTDFESVGNEVFAKCLVKYDHNRASFSTFLYKALVRAFISLVRAELRERQRQATYADLYFVGNTEVIDTLWLAEFVLELGADAKEVVRVLLEEELKVIGRETQRNIKSALYRFFGERTRNKPIGALYVRWSADRVRKAFREIESAL